MMNYKAVVAEMPSNSDRLNLYNRYSDKATKKFPDTGTAIRRTAKVLEEKNVKLKDIAGDLSDEVFEKVKAIPSERTTGLPGPKSKFSGGKIHRLVKENPRRKDTHGYKSWEAIKYDGVPYEDYLKVYLGRTKDLASDVKNGYVEIRYDD